jgi:hypothetical protein
MLSDADWAQIGTDIMHRTGLAPVDDEGGVRWVAVQHAADHIHIVATLARQDGCGPRIWYDFYRVREACRNAETQFGLRPTALADRTADRRPGRAETEQAARRRWKEPPRVRLRREVATAAAGAGTEQEFFTRLAGSGVAVHKRYSTLNPSEVTGYAVGLPEHVSKHGGLIWYSGGKLAADLSLPKLRRRWSTPGSDGRAFSGRGLSDTAQRAVLRNMVTDAADQAQDEAGFFARLRTTGIQVRLRFSEVNPGQVTGYSVSLGGQSGSEESATWYSGGRLADSLTLPRLRQRWNQPWSSPAHQGGAFRFTTPERDAIYTHAARQAAHAAEHIRRCAYTDPARAADAAWAAADTLYVAARALRNPELRRAADSFGRAARAPYGRIPSRTHDGDRLRATARLLAMTGASGDGTMLVANLVALVVAVMKLRQAQLHTAQASAAAKAAAHLCKAMTQPEPSAGRPAKLNHPKPVAARNAADFARQDSAAPLKLDTVPQVPRPSSKRGPSGGARRPSRRTGPAP